MAVARSMRGEEQVPVGYVALQYCTPTKLCLRKRFTNKSDRVFDTVDNLKKITTYTIIGCIGTHADGVRVVKQVHCGAFRDFSFYSVKSSNRFRCPLDLLCLNDNRQ
jgi:hypothetical protein